MDKINFTVIYYPQTNGTYTAICPELTLATQGDSIEEAEKMIKELIDDYMKHDKAMDYEDYVEGFNTGHKIITEVDYEFAKAD